MHVCTCEHTHVHISGSWSTKASGRTSNTWLGEPSSYPRTLGPSRFPLTQLVNLLDNKDIIGNIGELCSRLFYLVFKNLKGIFENIFCLPPYLFCKFISSEFHFHLFVLVCLLMLDTFFSLSGDAWLSSNFWEWSSKKWRMSSVGLWTPVGLYITVSGIRTWPGDPKYQSLEVFSLESGGTWKETLEF